MSWGRSRTSIPSASSRVMSRRGAPRRPGGGGRDEPRLAQRGRAPVLAGDDEEEQVEAPAHERVEVAARRLVLALRGGRHPAQPGEAPLRLPLAVEARHVEVRAL